MTSLKPKQCHVVRQPPRNKGRDQVKILGGCAGEKKVGPGQRPAARSSGVRRGGRWIGGLCDGERAMINAARAAETRGKSGRS